MTIALTKLPGRTHPIVEGTHETVGYDERRLTHLAREIAMDILEVEDILRLNNVRPEEWEAIQDTPAFQVLLTREMERWNSGLSTAERIRIKAMFLVEDSLLAASQVINNAAEGAQGRARMLEAVAKIANVGEKAQGGAEGGKVIIQIGMGADQHLNHEVTPKVTIIDQNSEGQDA